MRTISLGKALFLALLLVPTFASAAGFGRLTVQSNIGQPLNVEIDLVSVRADEAPTLAARLASPDAYQQANLQYNSALTGIKLAIERRPDGQYFIRVIGTRPVNEPFVDLLIELSGGGSRLTREYTVLLDPPGYPAAPVVAAPAAPARPVAAPAQPAAAPVVPPPAAKPIRGAPVAGGKAQEYGPIGKGETLGRIAATLKPEGVSLEQMMVGLYRSNPDAFINKNMNLVKSGKILRVPDAQDLAAISQGDAVKEYKTQVADWRAYSGRVADQATAVPEGGSTSRGRITAKVEDPAASGGKDVVKLSKGEPGPGGKALTGGDKARALQEELVARNKELAEANERIALLEKTIKDTQKLVELKSGGMAAAQQKADAAKAPAKPEPAKTEAAQPAAAPAPVVDTKPADTPAAPAKDASAPAETQPVAEAKPAQKPAPKPVAPPPPPPEPELMDVVMENLPLVGGGLGALLVGGIGIAALRRRRARGAAGQDDVEPVMPVMAGAAAVAAAGDAVAEVPAAEAASEDVDPVQEAEVYIAYGRDGQAEEILKEAMAQNPAREDVQAKLAEIYANRGDAASFAPVAQSLHDLSGGAGDNWTKVAGLGYAMDPANTLYEAGRDAAPAAAGSEAVATDLDFDLGGDSAATPDIQLESDAGQSTEIGGLQDMASAADAGIAPAEPMVPDFNLDAPATEAAPDISLDMPSVASSEPAAIDFNFDLPALDTPAAAAPAEPAAPAADGGLDFKIDVGDLNINLDEPATSAVPAAEKSGHWYDVQQKFDLAKAYQEMGDNEGAREILQEVIKEGDNEQKDQAQKLLSSLG